MFARRVRGWIFLRQAFFLLLFVLSHRLEAQLRREARIERLASRREGWRFRGDSGGLSREKGVLEGWSCGVGRRGTKKSENMRAHATGREAQPT
jgi:hypothetical protein